MKLMTNKEKLELVKAKREEIKNYINTNLEKENELLSNTINDYTNLYFSEESEAKEYKAIIDAKSLISSFVYQIKEADSLEKVIEIRKRLNYYINKIKKELIRRNIKESELNNYIDNCNNLRKNISVFIRYLKREDNLSKINELLLKDKLSIEEKKLLTKMFRNEINFTKRTILNYNKPKEEIKKSNNPIEEALEKAFQFEEEKPKEINLDGVFESLNKSEEENENNINDVDNIFKLLPEQHKTVKLHSFPTSTEHYNKMVIHQLQKYEIIDNRLYNQGFFGNIFVFFRNLPNYIRNKKSLRKMIYDSENRYKGKDLKEAIEFVKRNNSIWYGLCKVFSNSHLSERENYLQNKLFEEYRREKELTYTM